MKTILLRLADWIYTHYGYGCINVSPQVMEIGTDAEALVNKLESELDKSGEWKRHQAYAALIKMHPNAARRDIALAIELALR